MPGVNRKTSTSQMRKMPPATDSRQSAEYYQTKSAIFAALIEAIDLSQLAKLDGVVAKGVVVTARLTEADQEEVGVGG